MNLGDPELELIDPTPNVTGLFIHFDELFFKALLKPRAFIRWSKRMYSCAGMCTYEGRWGSCEIVLSEPLLKLRPRKDLVETLLHEMIHAFLFITNRDNDRSGHGPPFLALMRKINQEAGINITVYHDFQDEVRLYQKHVWRCNGICVKRPPHFGAVRRTSNRAPSSNDYWWNTHKRTCGGTFIKILGPEMEKKETRNKNKNGKDKKKPKVDVKLFEQVVKKPVSSYYPATSKPNTQLETTPERKRKNCIETVRDAWINRIIPTNKAISLTLEPPPKKVKKIDDYFKNTASSILKDVYGKEFKVTQPNAGQKLKAIAVESSDDIKKEPDGFVQCPSCNANVRSQDINRHLDECLNHGLIENFTNKQTSNVTNNILKPVNFTNDSNIIIKAEPSGTIKEDHVNQVCPCCDEKMDKPFHLHLDECLGFFNNDVTIPEEGASQSTGAVEDDEPKQIKTEPGTKDETEVQKCACCGDIIDKPMEIHFEECVGFFDNDNTIPEEGAAAIETIVIDDEDDVTNESQVLNPTGTKWPCPCCFQMVEFRDMNIHLDACLEQS